MPSSIREREREKTREVETLPSMITSPAMEDPDAAAPADAAEDRREEGGVLAADVGGSVAEEKECRICRSPAEAGNPLRYPCACRGTIKYVHQDCLLQWLNRRKISHCEVCKHEFSYVPVYARNAPARLPPSEFVLGLAAKLFWLLGKFQCFAYCFLVWLVVVPFTTHWIWEFSFFKGLSEAQSLFISHLNATAIFKDCLHGFLLSFGMAYVFLGITFIGVFLPQDPRGALGLANRIFAENENGGNVGGRLGITKVFHAIKRSLLYLANWWKMLVARIMVYFGIVEIELLIELVNLQAPNFLFNGNAFVVVASNLVFTVLVVLLPFCLGRIATLLQSLLFSSATAQILSSAVPRIEAALFSVNTKAKDALNAITYFVLYCYGVSMPSQIFEGDSEIVDIETTKREEVSNTVNGLVLVGLYNEQRSGTPALSDDTTILIGYVVILAFVLFYFGTVSLTRYARGETVTVPWLSRITFKIGAVLSLVVRRIFTQFRQVIIVISRNFPMLLKVGLVLGVKVGVFPLICGWWLDVCTLRMFGQTFTDRIALSMKYPLWMCLAYWTVGICYLVYVFIHANIIQQVFRDGVFHFLPNIVDPENFLSRVIEYPMFEHARDILLLVGVHGSLMVMLVFLPIKLVNISMPSAFPLNLFYSEAKTVGAVVLRRSLFHFGLPCTVRLYYPSKTFKVLLREWVIFTCSLLSLSEYLLPRNENNGGNVERPRRQRVRNASLFAIIEGSIVGLQTQEGTDATENGNGEDLEADSLFALRILILLILAWMTALVFNSLMMAVPLLLGRALSQAASHLLVFEGFKSDDFCSLIVGSCSMRAVVIFTKHGVAHAQRRGVTAFLSQIRDYCMSAFKICVLVSLGLFVIPTVVGLLLDLVLVVPVPLPLAEVSVITFFQCWVLGWLFLITSVGLIMADNVFFVDERWLVKLQRALNDGLARRHALSVLKEFLVVLSTAYMLARLVLAVLGYPFLANSIFHRFVWPGYFAMSIMWFCARIIYASVTYLHKKIRDDRYCVGQRLCDYGEDARGRQNEEENALELQN